jgi:hypothetical protein
MAAPRKESSGNSSYKYDAGILGGWQGAREEHGKRVEGQSWEIGVWEKNSQ